ncbi:hypothetical protein [Helicobacter himalayensis]|nr:hypothetical protein [Helicobacter himalayensis]
MIQFKGVDSKTTKQHCRILESHQPKNAECAREAELVRGFALVSDTF